MVRGRHHERARHHVMSRSILCCLLTQIEGVWHTSIVVHGVEYVYGYGVQRAVPGTTPFGQPLHEIHLG